MQLTNPSPSLHNEDLAPATERKWGAFSIFNVWTSDVHSLWGYYLAASLFLLCGSFVNFVIAIGAGSLVIFVLMSMVGNAGVRTGVPFPVLARASLRHLWRQCPGLGARDCRLLLVWRADLGRLGGHRRPADPQPRHVGVSHQFATCSAIRRWR